MIEMKILGTQSLRAQRHIIAEVAVSRSKLWLTCVAGNTASEMRQANLMANATRIPESI